MDERMAPLGHEQPPRAPSNLLPREAKRSRPMTFSPNCPKMRHGSAAAVPSNGRRPNPPALRCAAGAPPRARARLTGHLPAEVVPRRSAGASLAARLCRAIRVRGLRCHARLACDTARFAGCPPIFGGPERETIDHPFATAPGFNELVGAAEREIILATLSATRRTCRKRRALERSHSTSPRTRR